MELALTGTVRACTKAHKTLLLQVQLQEAWLQLSTARHHVCLCGSNLSSAPTRRGQSVHQLQKTSLEVAPITLAAF